eukprot:gene3642-6458_t
MSTTRINLHKNKKTNSIKIQKREAAQLMAKQKDESARIKVENIIREDYAIEALEIIELFVELLLSRIQVIVESKTCPHDLKEAITTMCYAATRLEIKEFGNIRDEFAKKFGKDFVRNAAENKDLSVNQRVMFKLGVKVPEPYLCVQYMKEIAAENNVQWDDSSMTATVETSMGLNPQQQQQQNIHPSFNQNVNPYSQQQQQQQQNQQPTFTQNDFESKLDPIQYVNELKKKQNEVKSSGYQVNFNPQSDPHQVPSFITSGNPNVFQNEYDNLNEQELSLQQQQLKDLMKKQQESDQLKKLQQQQQHNQTHDFFQPAPTQNEFVDFDDLKSQLQDQNRQSISNLSKNKQQDLGYNPSQSMIDFEKEMSNLGVKTKTTETSNDLLDFENQLNKFNEPKPIPKNAEQNFAPFEPSTNPFEEMQFDQKKTQKEEPKFVDEFSGFDEGMDFDDLQSRFESLKNRE